MLSGVIRPAIPADSTGIATVHVKTWQHAYKGQIPDSYLESLSIEKRTETWRNQIENPAEGVHIIVAEKDHQIVGWCTFGKNRDEDTTLEVGELSGIYVLPDFIGTGFGSKLFEYAMHTMKQEGYTKATLWVLDTNQKTRQWYESKGWRVEGKTKTDHRDTFDLNETRYIIDL